MDITGTYNLIFIDIPEFFRPSLSSWNGLLVTHGPLLRWNPHSHVLPTLPHRVSTFWRYYVLLRKDPSSDSHLISLLGLIHPWLSIYTLSIHHYRGRYTDQYRITRIIELEFSLSRPLSIYMYIFSLHIKSLTSLCKTWFISIFI